MQYSCTCNVANNPDLLYLTQLQLEMSPLQEHFISSLHDQKTSGIVIQTGTNESDTLVQAKSRETDSQAVLVLVAQILARYTARRACSRASLVGGSLTIARVL